MRHSANAFWWGTPPMRFNGLLGGAWVTRYSSNGLQHLMSSWGGGSIIEAGDSSQPACGILYGVSDFLIGDPNGGQVSDGFFIQKVVTHI